MKELLTPKSDFKISIQKIKTFLKFLFGFEEDNIIETWKRKADDILPYSVVVFVATSLFSAALPFIIGIIVFSTGITFFIMTAILSCK